MIPSTRLENSPFPAAAVQVLDEFRRARGRDCWVWRRVAGDWELAAGSSPSPVTGPSGEEVPVRHTPDNILFVEVFGDEGGEAEFLAAMLARVLDHEAESRFFGGELAERYEEITLLYSISEILGSVISLEVAARTILTEVVGTLRATRAALWLHNVELERLELVAAVGGEGQAGPIPVDAEESVTAAVFRSRNAAILEAGDEFPRGHTNHASRKSFLSVPVSYTPPNGATRTIGVINLTGGMSEDSFSAGDQKLVAAIASQIGAAVENSRLIATSLRQERIDKELELAHHLQLKLLPACDEFEDYAEVAARCLPADSVGGDFYHLFRLTGGRMGVMIGDVSSHGFGAALIMALTMSAVAIHASEGDAPGEVIRRTHRTLANELESTEMYLTLFYGVVNPERGEIVYVNAGHSHAFKITEAGEAMRLGATSPPMGMVDGDGYAEATAPWSPGEDLLLLFTDGLSDALGAGEIQGERMLVDEAVRSRTLAAGELLERLFRLTGDVTEAPADDRTAVLVRI
jgi:phosphoserine phosphatase RsbU/P